MIKHESICLFEALEKSDYQENVKSILGSLFFDHFFNNQNKIYLLTNQIGFSQMVTNIFVLHHQIKIQTQAKVFYIPILLYLPDSFPFGMPELYFERKNNIVINQKLPQGLVSNTDLRIHFEYFQKWSKEAKGVLDVLGYLFTIFTKAFPLYSSKKETEYSGNCIFDYDHSILVKLDQAAPITFTKFSELNISKASTQMSKTSNGFSGNNNVNGAMFSTPGDNLLEIETPQGNEEEMKKEKMLSDEEIQIQLQEDLNRKLFQLTISKRKKIKDNEQNMLKTKRELEEKIKQINQVCSKEAEIMGIVNNLYNELDQGVNFALPASNNEDLLSMPIQKRCVSMITIKNPKTFARLVVELTIEEMLPLYKKLYEKNQISFEEAIKSIRNQSSKLFKIKEAQRRNGNI